ncbi:MAG: hypothetical protein ABSD11_20975, partial [Methylocella sp.]
DLPVELTALEKIIHAQHASSLPPKVSSRGICSAFAVCTRAFYALPTTDFFTLLKECVRAVSLAGLMFV